MDIKLFDYHLPDEYIAQEPLRERDHSKLMVLNRKDGGIRHKKFHDIVEFMNPGDILVLNNSKVLPVRLFGIKKETGGKVETLLIKPLSDSKWKALMKPGKRIHLGTEITFSTELEGKVIEKDENEGNFLLNMNFKGNLYKILNKIGKMPTPPYIKKELLNSSYYQTVYASEEGSIAAPTAGFHFTNKTIEDIGNKGIKILFLTLHIGRGTFEMMKVDKVEDHKMKSEIYTLTSENAEFINKAIENKHRIVGVGTSVTRALESSVDPANENRVIAGTRWTDLFIYPGYKFKVIKSLITNFHLPRSTPLMLASAFAGKDFLLNAYNEALKKKYRFYSFGDAMFII